MKPPFSIAHYDVTALIGKGGMGDVYRARDTKLGREVAIKVLPSEVATDQERLARFQREARSVAALNHANIVTLYSVEEWQGVHFLTMELVDGMPLDSLIPADGLPPQRILEIAESIAHALTAAHDKGLAHRDLKPANVMIANDGRVKVLDFGLAKDIRNSGHSGNTATALGQTQEGVAMGTPPYMSPEQILGREVDHRTDVFSLGVMLHEMTTGSRPFQGTTSVEIAASILRDTPPPITTTKPGLPSGLQELIQQCLAKDASQRIQTARQVTRTLQEMQQLLSSRRGGLQAAAGDSGIPRLGEGFWVAVAPFQAGAGETELSALASGLTEEIIAGLSRFSYLRVLTKGTTGARYILEGTLRQAGGQLRVAVRLIDTSTGANLWAENYTRPFSADTIFEIQDSLVPVIVAPVAETNGVLEHHMWIALRARDPLTLTPYEAMLWSFGYNELLTPETHQMALAALKRAIEREPNHSGCLSQLAVLYADSHLMDWPREPNSLDLCLSYARRAVAAEPSNGYAYVALAWAHGCRKEAAGVRNAAERAFAMNPLDGAAMANIGLWTAYGGDWQRGCELVERAMKLNLRHVGWYWYVLVHSAYRQRDYPRALDYALRINLSGQFWTHIVLAMIHGQMGNRAEAADALRDLLALKPDFAANARQEIDKWFTEISHTEHVLDGLRKAGLFDQAGTDSAPTSTPAPTDKGLWVAVKPFTFRGADPAIQNLTEGLTEEISTGLSRFGYIRVTARGADTSAIRYLLEGNIRQAGSRLRVTVQLNDTETRAQLWAETYERAFAPDAFFEIQDDLVARIVSTCADSYGVLPASISEAIRGTPPTHWSPSQALARFFGYHQRLTPADHLEARQGLEHAIEVAPRNADCWAMLSLAYGHEHAHGFNPLPDPLGRALTAAKRAVDLAPGNHLAHQALSTVLLLRKEIAACLHEANRAIALNPLASGSSASMGANIAFAGDWDRGCALIARAMDLNPQHPVWYRGMLAFNEYAKGNYSAAVAAALQTNAPELFWLQVLFVAAYGQLGEQEAAAKAMSALDALVPHFSAKAKAILGTWMQPAFTEHIVEGLRKAGMRVG